MDIPFDSLLVFYLTSEVLSLVRKALGILYVFAYERKHRLIALLKIVIQVLIDGQILLCDDDNVRKISFSLHISAAKKHIRNSFEKKMSKTKRMKHKRFKTCASLKSCYNLRIFYTTEKKERNCSHLTNITPNKFCVYHYIFC